MAEPLLDVQDLRKYFPAGRFLLGRVRAWVKAVDDISFTIHPGETLGLVGESGCGKTTTCKLVLAAEEATAGAIVFEGRDIVGRNGKDLRDYRRKVQVVFQDPYSSLSPRLRVGDIISEPMLAHEKTSRAVMRSRVGELLELVGLRPDMTRLFPHEFSGGQRQRIAIARALSTNARLIVLDEPVSALDVSIRAHIIALLEDIQQRLGVSYLFVGHDLAAVAHISHRIAVMYLGKIVEVADSLELYNKPLHPYTKALFAASLPSHPDEEREKIVLTGEVPSALNPPSGCHFHPRCPFVMPHCSEIEPEPVELAPGHTVACHLYSGNPDIRRNPMQQFTRNVFVETQVRGCNHGFVTTSEGIVMIDSPHKPSDALKLKAEIAKHGELRYIINTEPHGDHWTGNAYFDAPVVAHEGVRRRMLDTNMEEHVARVATFGPEESKLLEGYAANVPVMTFKNGMTLHVGDHTFEMIHMPGHTPYQAAVLIKEEGVVFTSDNIFHKVQTWLHEANPDLWLVALESLRRLDEETFVPGHGAICDKGYLDEQGAFVQEWKEYVKNGIDRGMTKDEAVANLTAMTDRYPMDVGQDGMAPMVMRINVANLYDYLTGA